MSTFAERTSPPFILIAEDNADDRLLVEYAFRRAGLPNRFAIVPDGQKVIAWLSRQAQYRDVSAYPDPELLVLDLHMPEKDGFEVLEWIRGQSSYGNLPVVVMSAIRAPETVERALAMGARNYLFKAGDYGELTRFISDLNFMNALHRELLVA